MIQLDEPGKEAYKLLYGVDVDNCVVIDDVQFKRIKLAAGAQPLDQFLRQNKNLAFLDMANPSGELVNPSDEELFVASQSFYISFQGENVGYWLNRYFRNPFHGTIDSLHMVESPLTDLDSVFDQYRELVRQGAAKKRVEGVAYRVGLDPAFLALHPIMEDRA